MLTGHKPPLRINAVVTAVKDLQQTVVAEIKAATAHGKISETEKRRIKDAAVANVKSYLGAKGIRVLAEVLGLSGGGLESFLGSKVEAAVLFNPDSTFHETTVVERCLREPEALYPISRYVDGFLALPMVASACTSDFTPALDAITRQLGAMLSGDCIVARPSLGLGDDGRVGCGVEEILATGSGAARCATGPRPYGCPFPEEGGSSDPCDCPPETAVLDPETGREVCKLDQIPRSELVTSDEGACAAPDGARGWFYDDCTVARIRRPLPTPACR